MTNEEVFIAIHCLDLSNADKRTYKKRYLDGFIGQDEIFAKLTTEGKKELYQKECDYSEKMSHHYIFDGDEDYPKSLLEWEDRPFCITLNGHKRHLASEENICLISGENTNVNGGRELFKFAIEARSNNIVVFARFNQVDKLIHTVATSYALVPCGLEECKEYKDIQEAIDLNEGGILSFTTLNDKVSEKNIQYVNKVLAIISQNIVVFQAEEESPELDIVNNALDFATNIYIHSVGLENVPECKGTIKMARDGAINISGYKYLQKYSLNPYKGNKYIKEITFEEYNKIRKTLKEVVFRFRDEYYVCY